MTVESLPTLTAADIALGEWVSSYEAERVTGYSRETLKRLFYQGQLEAARYPKTKGGTNYRWYFKRGQLAAKSEPNRGKSVAKSSKPKESLELMDARVLEMEGKLMKLKAIRTNAYPIASRTIAHPQNTESVQPIELPSKATLQREDFAEKFCFLGESGIEAALKTKDAFLLGKVYKAHGLEQFEGDRKFFVRMDVEDDRVIVWYVASEKEFERLSDMKPKSVEIKDDGFRVAVKSPPS